MKRTCLYDFHLENGAQMVDFAGFSMPGQYMDLSVTESAKHTRSRVSMFDVSHMMQSELSGTDREEFIESLTPANVKEMAENSGTLSVFTNSQGGVIDDLIITKTDREILYLVTNAGRIDVDLAHLQGNCEQWRRRGKDVKLNVLEDIALIAVQGPEMTKLLQAETDISFDTLFFMQSTIGQVCGIHNCRVTRCGYTGEDGVELSIPAKYAQTLAQQLLASKATKVKLAGLSVRDVLRIEAGLCLYGNDLSEEFTPVEAAIPFVIAKRRRQTLGFPGAERIMKQLEKKNITRKRVGLIATKGGRSPRGGMPVQSQTDGAVIGSVTSGCPSPCIGKNIAMAYVEKQYTKPGTLLNVEMGTGRKLGEVEVVKMPFVKTNYYVKKDSS